MLSVSLNELNTYFETCSVWGVGQTTKDGWSLQFWATPMGKKMLLPFNLLVVLFELHKKSWRIDFFHINTKLIKIYLSILATN